MRHLDSRPRHPTEQRRQLTAVAHTETERVRATVELVELGGDLVVEADHAGPALRRVEHVRIRESAHEDSAPESVQPDTAGQQVCHRHVPWLESRREERRCHFPVRIRSFLAQNRDPVLRLGCQHFLRRRPVVERHAEARARPRPEAVPLFRHECRIGLQGV